MCIADAEADFVFCVNAHYGTLWCSGNKNESRSTLSAGLAKFRNLSSQTQNVRTAERICHGDSGGGFQTGVIRQNYVLKGLCGQAMSSCDATKTRDRRVALIRYPDRLQSDRAGDAWAKRVLDGGGFMPRQEFRARNCCCS